MPATGSRKQRFSSHLPGWMLPLMLISFLIAVLLVGWVERHEDVLVPTCSQCDGDRARVRLIRVAMGLGGFALCAVAIATSSAALGWVGVLLLVVWMFALTDVVDPLYRVRGRVIDDSWLELRAVHSNFIAALRPNPAWAVPATPGYPSPAYAPQPGFAPY